MIKLKVLIISLLWSGATLAEDFDLKSFKLGSEISTCPAGEQTGTPLSIGKDKLGVETCHLGPTTFAGKPASALTLDLYEGRVVGITVRLSERGRYANGGARDALISRFGNVDRESSMHLNQWEWTQGDARLSLDGWEGRVSLRDRAAWQRIRDAAGAKGKSDT